MRLSHTLPDQEHLTASTLRQAWAECSVHRALIARVKLVRAAFARHDRLLSRSTGRALSISSFLRRADRVLGSAVQVHNQCESYFFASGADARWARKITGQPLTKWLVKLFSFDPRLPPSKPTEIVQAVLDRLQSRRDHLRGQRIVDRCVKSSLSHPDWLWVFNTLNVSDQMLSRVFPERGDKPPGRSAFQSFLQNLENRFGIKRGVDFVYHRTFESESSGVRDWHPHLHVMLGFRPGAIPFTDPNQDRAIPVYVDADELKGLWRFGREKRGKSGRVLRPDAQPGMIGFEKPIIWRTSPDDGWGRLGFRWPHQWIVPDSLKVKKGSRLVDPKIKRVKGVYSLLRGSRWVPVESLGIVHGARAASSIEQMGWYVGNYSKKEISRASAAKAGRRDSIYYPSASLGFGYEFEDDIVSRIAATGDLDTLAALATIPSRKQCPVPLYSPALRDAGVVNDYYCDNDRLRLQALRFFLRMVIDSGDSIHQQGLSDFGRNLPSRPNILQRLAAMLDDDAGLTIQECIAELSSDRSVDDRVLEVLHENSKAATLSLLGR